jgi:hypothetical protein
MWFVEDAGFMQMFVIEMPFDSLVDDTLNMLPSAQESAPFGAHAKLFARARFPHIARLCVRCGRKDEQGPLS